MEAVKRWLKAHRREAAAALVVLALAGWGFKKWRASKEAPPVFETVSKGAIEQRFRDSGEVAARSFVDVASKVSGRVTELKVEEGSPVRKGQPLAVIQPGRTGAEQYVPSTLEAPMAGTLMRYVSDTDSKGTGRFPRVSDYVTGLFDSQNPTYLFTVADLSRMIVRMQISEMDILKLTPGMKVDVTVDALPGKTFAGRVDRIAPQAEKGTGGLKVFKVEVALDENDARLRPGMTARVDALLQRRESALKAPLAGLFEEGGKDILWLRGPGDKPVRVEVELGLRGEMEAELVKADGVDEGAKLYTERPKDAPKAPGAAAPGAAAGRAGRRAARAMRGM